LTSSHLESTPATPSPSSAFSRLGGEEKLRNIVRDFIQRVYRDPIIGFFFTKIDQAQLIEREYEYAAQHLGADIAYQGRPIGRTHRPHRINLGQFHRRLWILQKTLEDHLIPPDIAASWLERERLLVNAVTTGLDCNE
jgi:hemoglobin